MRLATYVRQDRSLGRPLHRETMATSYVLLIKILPDRVCVSLEKRY